MGTSDPQHQVLQVRIELDSVWLDSQYHHVHHGRCLYLLERARLELLERMGFPDRVFLERGDGLVITRLQVEYKREVVGEFVVATCDRVGRRGRDLIVHQRLLNHRSKVAVEAVVESQFMDLATRRGKDVPADFLAAYESLPLYDPNLAGCLEAGGERSRGPDVVRHVAAAHAVDTIRLF
jgi:acyl-CoA thioesterase FadM